MQNFPKQNMCFLKKIFLLLEIKSLHLTLKKKNISHISFIFFNYSSLTAFDFSFF